MTAVIWTDVVQMTLYVAGAIAQLCRDPAARFPAAGSTWSLVAGGAGQVSIFDFRFAPDLEFFCPHLQLLGRNPGGCFLTTATHGTDQLMVQRLLSARDERQSRTALSRSWLVILLQFVLFLLIGILLFVHYSDSHASPPAQMDRLYPEFVWNNLPRPGRPDHGSHSGSRHGQPQRRAEFAGFHHRGGFLPTPLRQIRDRSRGLRIARWPRRLGRRAAGHGHGRAAFWNRCWRPASPSLHPDGRAAGRLSAGRAHAQRVRGAAAIAGVASGLTIVVGIHFYTPIAWTWYVLIGTLTTFGVGLFSSLFQGPAPLPLEAVGVRQPLGGLPHLPSRRSSPRSNPPMENTTRTELKRALGPWAAASIVVGAVIGSGIFLVPRTMIEKVGTVEAVFAVWVVGGLLPGRSPELRRTGCRPAGGRRRVCFSPRSLRTAVGFSSYSWTQMWVAKSGSIATLATGFFLYLTTFFEPLKGVIYTVPLPIGPNGGPLEIQYGQLFAIALILSLAWANYYGVKNRRQCSGCSYLPQSRLNCRHYSGGSGARQSSRPGGRIGDPADIFRLYRGPGGGPLGLRRVE